VKVTTHRQSLTAKQPSNPRSPSGFSDPQAVLQCTCGWSVNVDGATLACGQAIGAMHLIDVLLGGGMTGPAARAIATQTVTDDDMRGITEMYGRLTAATEPGTTIADLFPYVVANGGLDL
jgi:hypothetical protein